MIIFDGYAFAAAQETELKARTERIKAQGEVPHIAAILFEEDEGSRLYTRLKREAAERVGMRYSVFTFSMNDLNPLVTDQIKDLNRDPDITGIIIQKPWRVRWEEVTHFQAESPVHFETWWHELVATLDVTKDVDGLHPATLAAVRQGTWREEHKVLPATARAVLAILRVADEQLRQAGQNGLSPEAAYTILGKSDILGKPLFYELANQGREVEMIGSAELKGRIEQGVGLSNKDVIISATGRNKLITGSLLKPGSVVIDVGEPKPDIDRSSVQDKAGFLTPVPGGVGPVTVVSLLANALDLLDGKRGNEDVGNAQ